MKMDMKTQTSGIPAWMKVWRALSATDLLSGDYNQRVKDRARSLLSKNDNHGLLPEDADELEWLLEGADQKVIV